MLFWQGAESNPALLAAFGSYGLAGFVALKLALSLAIILPSYELAVMPGTRPVGISAMSAITAGGALATINNVSALATGTSLFYSLLGDGSFVGPGVLVALAMLITGALTYGILGLSPAPAGSRAFH